jgi:cellulose synthase (UDP-forming)
MKFGRHFRSEADGMRLVSGGRVVRRKLSGWTAAPVGLFLGVTAVYWTVRLPSWNPHAAVLATLLLAAELFGVLRLALHLFATHSLLERDAVRVGPEVRADIFIPTAHEPVERLRNTLVAAKAIRGAGLVWLLDGGDRADMRALAAELGVAYLARAGSARADLLNHALKLCQAEFVALFDGDHAPAPEFLERTLGYFADEALAFVQTPQDFYNIDSFQHRSREARGEFWHEQALLFRVIQPGRDRWNAAVFCGSCALLRRAALDDIGGFAGGTAAEDLHASLRFHKRGWRSVYHNESLAFGLSPSDIGQYLAQALGRARGALQVWRREGILFTPGLTPAQRLCYLGQVLGALEGWQKLILYTTPIVVLLTGDLPVTRVSGWLVGLLLPWLGLGVWIDRLTSRGYARTLWMEEYSLLRYAISLRATVELAFPRAARAGAAVEPPGGEDRVHRRLLPQLVLVAASIVAVAFAATRAFAHPYLPAGALLFCLAWVAVCAGLLIRACWFTTRRVRYRRDHHRFNLPVPVTLRVGDGRRYRALAQDLSLSGLRIELAGALVLPQTVQGKLHLPFCTAGFSGVVVGQSDEPGRGRTARLSLQWASDEARDAARALLFGNSLQWDVNHWRELQSGPRRRDPADQSWSFCRLQTAAGAVPCIVRRAGERRWRVVAYTPFNDRPILALERAGAGPVRGLSVVSYRSYPIGSGGVFVGELAPSGARTLAMPALGPGRPMMDAATA